MFHILWSKQNHHSLECGGRFRNTCVFYQHLDDTELDLTITDFLADVLELPVDFLIGDFLLSNSSS